MHHMIRARHADVTADGAQLVMSLLHRARSPRRRWLATAARPHVWSTQPVDPREVGGVDIQPGQIGSQVRRLPDEKRPQPLMAAQDTKAHVSQRRVAPASDPRIDRVGTVEVDRTPAIKRPVARWLSASGSTITGGANARAVQISTMTSRAATSPACRCCHLPPSVRCPISAKAFGNTSSDYGQGVACDSAGNVYLTGYYHYDIDLGGGKLTSKGSNDWFMASFTSAGAHRWSRSHGSTSSDYGRRVAADSAGNAYFTGTFYSAVDFGGGPLTSKGSGDIALVKVGP
jgi:Beta-propeller repeat